MWCNGKLSHNRRGTGSIIGIVFIFLLLLSASAFYILNVNVTEEYIKTVQDMQQLDSESNKEDIEFSSVSLTSDNKLNVTVKNTGSYQVHLIWLGIFNKTSTPETQQYFSINTYVDTGRTVASIGSSLTITSTGQKIVQLVTEKGNIFHYDMNQITLTGPDTIPYYQTSTDWRNYTISIPTTTGSPAPSYFSIYADGSSVEFNGISNPSWVHTDANGEYTVGIKSTSLSGETFTLYVQAGSLVAQKRITQGPG